MTTSTDRPNAEGYRRPMSETPTRWPVLLHTKPSGMLLCCHEQQFTSNVRLDGCHGWQYIDLLPPPPREVTQADRDEAYVKDQLFHLKRSAVAHSFSVETIVSGHIRDALAHERAEILAMLEADGVGMLDWAASLNRQEMYGSELLIKKLHARLSPTGGERPTGGKREGAL